MVLETILLPHPPLPTVRWNDILKQGDIHEKFNFLKIQDLKPLNTCQKHFADFEMILLIFH